MKLKIFSSFFISVSLQAIPHSPVVQSGDARFIQSGGLLEVAASDRTLIDWSEFSIEEKECVRFIQPDISSSVVNRVLEANPSHLFGRLESNGQVLLINPNGIVVGKEARIDTGSFIASTLDLNQDLFLTKGNLQFSGEPAGSIENHGTVASRGDLFLIGPHVANLGTLEAKQAGLIGTHAISLSKYVQTKWDESENPFQGTFILPTFARQEGTISASNIWILGDTVEIAQSTTDASGEFQGGRIWIGGDFQGQNPKIKNSLQVSVSPDAKIDASALVAGDAGRVVVWGTEGVLVQGAIFARGGLQRGNGGLVEVSSQGAWEFGWNVDLRAPQGTNGELLIDPTDVIIRTAGPFTAGVVFGVNTSWPALTTPVIIDSAALANFLNTMGSVTITTNVLPDPGAAGNITLNSTSPVVWTAQNTLTLIAANDINVNRAANIQQSAAASGINRVVLNAGRDINIVLAAGFGPTSVGSQNDGTLLQAGRDISIHGSSGQSPAQVGYFTPLGGSSTGPISVQCARNLTMRGGTNPQSGAIIGHGQFNSVSGVTVAANADIIVNVGGNIDMSPTQFDNPAQSWADSEVMIGHGAVTLNSAAGTNQIGNITVVCGGNLILNNTIGSRSIVGIGHGQFLGGGAVTANPQTFSGNIDVRVGGSTTLTGSTINPGAWAMIGHHILTNYGNAATQTLNGNITFSCGGDLLLSVGASAQSNERAIIGHFTGSANIHGVIGVEKVSVGGNLTLSVANNQPAPILNEAFIGSLNLGNTVLNTTLDLSVCGNATMTSVATISGKNGLGFLTNNPGASTTVANIAIGGDVTVSGSRMMISSVGNLNLAIRGNLTYTNTGTNENTIGTTNAGTTRIFVGGNFLQSQPGGGAIRIGAFPPIAPAGAPASWSTALDVRAGGDVQWVSNNATAMPGGIQILSGHPFAVGELWTGAGTSLLTVDGQTIAGGFDLRNAACTLLASDSPALGGTCGSFSVTATTKPVQFNTSGPLTISGACSGCSAPIVNINIGSAATNDIFISASPVGALFLGSFGTIVLNQAVTSTGNIDMLACGNLTQSAGSNLVSTGAGSHIFLTADSDLNGAGDLNLASNITSNNGPITLNAGFGGPSSSTASINQTGGAISSGTGAILAEAANNITVNGASPSFTSTSGNITMLANNNIDVLKNVSSTAGGNISITADLDNTGVGNLSVASNVATTTGNICLAAGPGTFGCSQNNCHTSLISGFPVGNCTVTITGSATSSAGGSITVTSAEDILVNGASPTISTSGPIALTAGLGNLTVNQQIRSSGSTIFTFAGNNTILTQTGVLPLIHGAAEIRMITGLNMTLNPNTAILSNLPGGQVTLVVDNIHPFFINPPFPSSVSGSLTMLANTSVTSGSPLRIFTAYSQIFGTGAGINFIDPSALLNGQSPAAFGYPGPTFANTLTEQWCVFFSCPANYPFPSLGVPFTIFYKICEQLVVQQAQIVTTEFLLDLHPYNEFPGWMEEFWLKYQGTGATAKTPSSLEKLGNEPYYFRRRHLNVINHPKSWTAIFE